MAFDPSIGRATQFRKGQSGNAGGRPKSRLLSEALRNRLAQTVADDPTGRTFAEAIADNLVRSKDDGSPLNPDVLRRDVLYPTLDRLGIVRTRRAAGLQGFIRSGTLRQPSSTRRLGI